MRVRELKKFAQSSNFKEKTEETQLAIIISIILHGVLVRLLYVLIIGYTAAFSLYIIKGLGLDWNMVQLICGYSAMIVIIKAWCNKVLDKCIK